MCFELLFSSLLKDERVKLRVMGLGNGSQLGSLEMVLGVLPNNTILLGSILTSRGYDIY